MSAATKILIIRHAEKPDDGMLKGVTSAGVEDPEELTVRGWQRTGALVRFFAPRDGRFVDQRLASPKTIFASGVAKHSKSLRPQHTVLELATGLKLSLDLRFSKGDEIELVKASLNSPGPVLIAWEHEAIPGIAKDILGNNNTSPQKWPGSRFDLVWVFERQEASGEWSFGQIPQMLLSGDSEQLIALSE